jgi:ABC-type glycerol-3-phosphate transport system permease component
MRTLAVGLTIFKGSFREITLWGELMACSCICSIPVIAIFLLGKKYLINNPQDGAIKE